MMKKLLLAGAIALASFHSWAATVDGVFDSTGVFSGASFSGNIAFSLTDVGANQVQLTLTSNLQPGAFVLPGDGFYFNLTNYTPVSLTNVTGPTGTLASSLNSFKPDGDGLMDLQLTFSPPGLKPFQAGETGVYLFTGAGLDALDFVALSECGQGCGTGAHYAAVHIGGIEPGGNSTWVGPNGEPRCVDCEPGQQNVPEPSTHALLGLSLLGLGFVARRKAALNK